jgi:dihydroorotate dehydrogenase
MGERLNIDLDLYRHGIRPFLFSAVQADPEWLHQQTLRTLNWLGHHHRSPAYWAYTQFEQSCQIQCKDLQQSLWGLAFDNPIGLAAGFDKDGLAASMWSGLGFGFAELGTVTLQPQPGNPPPRLFRLVADRAALNRMGFNNQGAAALAERLKETWRIQPRKIPIGINLGKSKVTPLDQAAADYAGSFRLLKEWGDYFVVNVSSPNTPGLRSLQAAEQLDLILSALQAENQTHKPLLVKIAPDLDWGAIATILELAQSHQLAGIIATNTTISREDLTTQMISTTGKSVHEEAGGISGAPLRQRSTEVIRFIYQQTAGNLPIIGVGGIFTADDAWDKITAGASLLQVYTGWIYEGPWMVRRILTGLSQKLQKKGLSKIQEAIGLDHGIR